MDRVGLERKATLRAVSGIGCGEASTERTTPTGSSGSPRARPIVFRLGDGRTNAAPRPATRQEDSTATVALAISKPF